MSKKSNSTKSRKLITIAATTALCLPLLGATSAEARPGHKGHDRGTYSGYASQRQAKSAKRYKVHKRTARVARRHIGVKRSVLLPPPRYRVVKNKRRVVYKRPVARKRFVVAKRLAYRQPVKVCRTVTEVQYQQIWLAGLRITKPVHVQKQVCNIVPASSASRVYRF